MPSRKSARNNPNKEPTRRSTRLRGANGTPGTNPTAPAARPTGTNNGTGTNTTTLANSADLHLKQIEANDLRRALRLSEDEAPATGTTTGATTTTTAPGNGNGNGNGVTLQQLVAQLRRTEAAVDGTGATAPALAPGAASAGRRGERVQAGQNLGRDLDEILRLAEDNTAGILQSLGRRNEDFVRRVEARRFEAGTLDEYERLAGENIRGAANALAGIQDLDRRNEALEDMVRRVEARRFEAGADEDPFVVDADGRVVGTTASAALAPGAASAGRRRGSAVATGLDNALGSAATGAARGDGAATGTGSGSATGLVPLDELHAQLDRAAAAAGNNGRVVGTAASAGRRGGSAAAGANGTFLFGAEEERRRDAEIDAFLAHGRQVNDVMAADTRRIVEENRQGVAANAEVLGAHGVAIAELQQGQEEIREEMDEMRRRLPPKKGKGGKRGGKK